MLSNIKIIQKQNVFINAKITISMKKHKQTKMSDYSCLCVKKHYVLMNLTTIKSLENIILKLFTKFLTNDFQNQNLMQKASNTNTCALDFKASNTAVLTT